MCKGMKIASLAMALMMGVSAAAAEVAARSPWYPVRRAAAPAARLSS